MPDAGESPLRPLVKTAAALPAELSVADHVAEDLRRIEAGAEGLGEVFGDAQADVEADEIGEAEWPHRMVVAELHRAVDVGGGCDALFEHPHRLEADGHAEAR